MNFNGGTGIDVSEPSTESWKIRNLHLCLSGIQALFDPHFKTSTIQNPPKHQKYSTCTPRSTNTNSSDIKKRNLIPPKPKEQTSFPNLSINKRENKNNYEIFFIHWDFSQSFYPPLPLYLVSQENTWRKLQTADKIDPSPPAHPNRLNSTHALFSLVHSIKVFLKRLKMVRAIEDNQEGYRTRLHHLREMHESAGRHTKSLSIEASKALENQDGDGEDESQTPTESNGRGLRSRKSLEESAAAAKEAKEKQQQSDMEQMRERFAKLLLGEDMSGGGKGVSSALALSNAITNLAASVFGEQTRLEPMSADRKARWRKELDWLLCVTDYIVEFVASQQKNKDGSNMEIMVTRQRTDLLMNIPALKKLDAMLIDCLDNFKGDQEFYYVSKDADEKEKGNAKRKDDKWWLPTPKVPPDGLSEAARKFLQYQKDCVNQVLKAAMAINAQVLTEMEIPENYIEALPKNGRASLGDQIYRSITVEFFDPDQFLCAMDLSSDHKILDLKNKMEASMVIWKRKMNQKDGKSGWGSAVSLEKRELFEERAETILLLLKQRFPGIPQSSLDISKIQYNGDVGQAILESYSRILESLAFTVLSRIEDVLYADYAVHNPSAISKKNSLGETTPSSPATSPDRLTQKDDNGGNETPTSMTLSDFMGWGSDQGDNEAKKEQEAAADETEVKHPHIQKLANIVTNKKMSYLETLGGMRSPTARH